MKRSLFACLLVLVPVLVPVLVLWPASTARADNAGDALQLLDQGINQFQKGKLEAARDAFARARDLVPDKPNPHRWLGLVYARMGRCAEAVGELESFIERVPPKDPRAVEAVTLRDRCNADVKPHVAAPAVEPAPPRPQVRLVEAAPPAQPTQANKKPRYWIAGVVAGTVAAVALGVGLGVGLGTASSGPTTLPPVRGASF